MSTRTGVPRCGIYTEDTASAPHVVKKREDRQSLSDQKLGHVGDQLLTYRAGARPPQSEPRSQSVLSEIRDNDPPNHEPSTGAVAAASS